MHRFWCACVAAVGVAAAGCPIAPGTTSPAGARGVDNVRIGKLARILRASDRRIVDDALRSLLADDDPSIRTKAVLALGQIGDRSSYPDLEKATSDPEAAVRGRAAFAIGLLGDPSGERAVVRLTADENPGVRAASAEALGRLGSAEAMTQIVQLLGDEDAGVREASALAAWKLPEPEPLLDSLVKDLSDTASGVRMASSYALARLASRAVAPPSSGAVVGRLSEAGVKRARAALVGSVSDANPEVRMNVARGLASPAGGPELAAVGSLTKDPVPGVRVNAVRSLGYPGIPIRPYLDHAMADGDQAVMRAALEALGAVGGPAAIEALDKIIIKLENGWLREAALLSMTKTDPTKAPGIATGLLANPNPRMRAAAAEILAGHSEPGALAAAAKMLADPVPAVQAVGVPIVASQDRAITPLLQGLFTAGDPVVRAAVAEAIGDRFAHPHPDLENSDDLFARLDEVSAASTNDTIPDAKLSVLDAAAKAGKDERARAAFERGLKDADVIVRRRAADRFKDVFGEDRSNDVGPAANRPMADYERIVRFGLVPHAAIVSLQRPGTAVGRFVVALDADAAPMAVWNLAELAKKSFFDGATVHRVVPNFVVQDGDPRGDGFGGPGYAIRDEFNPLRFGAGVLGMASSGKDTAGSQWFVTLSPQPHLDGRYTSFGRVTRAFREIVTQIRPGDTVVSIRVYEGNGTEPLPAN